MFQQMHTTADGQSMLIAQMKDSHLLNMIGVIVRRTEKMTDEFQSIVDADERSKADATFDGKAHTEAQRKIYGIPAPPDLEESTTQYAQAVAKASLFIEPYLLEAWTRGFDDTDELTFQHLRLRWQKAVGRNEALPFVQPMLTIVVRQQGTVANFNVRKEFTRLENKYGLDIAPDDYDDEPEQNW